MVLRKEVRSRRVHGDLGAFQDRGMFSMGQDAEHEGLCIPEGHDDVNRAPLHTGRAVRREDVFPAWLDEGVVAEPDLGESGTSSDEEG